MRTVLFIALIAGLACACSCLPPGSPAEEMAKSDAVFSGTAASVARDGSGYTVAFDVARAWKGVSSSAVSVHTAQDSAACGYDFVQGEEYIVYAYKDDSGSLATGLCSRTARLADARADTDALGPGNSVGKPPGDSSTLLLVTAVLVILGIAVLVWMRMK